MPSRVTVPIVVEETVPESSVAPVLDSPTTTTTTTTEDAVKKANSSIPASLSSSARTDEFSSSDAIAKTVTPKTESKKSGRSKKKPTELPSNQRTLGAFFGTAGGKKSVFKSKSKLSSNAVAAAAASVDRYEESDKPNNNEREKSANLAKASAAADKKIVSSLKANAGAEFSAKNNYSITTGSTKAASDEIKAIVLGPAFRDAKESSSFSKASMGMVPTSQQRLFYSSSPMPPRITFPKGVNPIATIPSAAIKSQKQIAMQEKALEEAREKQAMKDQTEEDEKDVVNDTVTTVDGVNKKKEDICTDQQSNGPSKSSVSPTPSKKEAKTKKRATLVPISSKITDVDSKPNDNESDGSPCAVKCAAESDDDPHEDDDATADVSPPCHGDGEDDEGEKADCDNSRSDKMDDEIDPVSTPWPVQRTKVLDLTLGDTDSNAPPSNGDPAPATGDVSKRLSFTPQKKNGETITAKTITSSVAKKAPTLDAFAVPISSIKATKKAKREKEKAAKREKEKAASKMHGSSYIKKRIAKEFDDGMLYCGTVTKYCDGECGGLWHILYDDGDEEDFSQNELEAGLTLFESETKKNSGGQLDGAKVTSVPPTKFVSEVEPVLSEEFKAVLAKNETLRKRYRDRAEDLVARSAELAEESFDLTVAMKEGDTTSPPEAGSFPDALQETLAVIVQGSPLPLSMLTNNAISELAKHTVGKNLTADAVSAKIKIMAARKQYLTTLSPTPVQVDKFEDAQACLLWRWELTTLDLLPAELISKAKKAQASRRKIANFHKAVAKLLGSLDKADALFLQSNSAKAKRDAALAKISSDEDKVLKYEREEEKQRLVKEAKAKKEEARKSVVQKKEQEKEERKKLAAKKKEEEKKAKEEEKKLAAAKREEERERKRQEIAKAKEEAKRKKEEEKAAKKREAEEKEEKQKARMISFFGATSPPRTKAKISRDRLLSQDASKLDSDTFWKSLDTAHAASDKSSISPPFKDLTDRAKLSRKRKTNIVSVTVFATVLPDNPFDQQQPYDEERTINVPNKYKFLAFHEDYRPPYRGTWSKPHSSIITGQTPFEKDPSNLDYDVDSEAEWEEGDEEEGEDCDVDGPNDDDDEDQLGNEEEGDPMMYNYDDGWLAQDDEYGIEDNDEETLAMRKKKVEDNADANQCRANQSTVCVVAPVMGGIPAAVVKTELDNAACPELVSELVEGVDPHVGFGLLSKHGAFDFIPCMELCMDLFPAKKVKQNTSSTKCGSEASPAKNQANASKEMSEGDLRAFAKFVHNSTLGSKDKIVEELQAALPDITSSRAQATRKLDSIAEKRRLKNGGGVVWEVKKDILESLHLGAKDLNDPPVETQPEEKPAAAKSPKRKASDPNAPKRSMSSYMFFSTTNRAKFKEDNPTATFGDLAKLISKAFKELSEEEKKKYDDMAAADKERYLKEKEAYEGTHGASATKKSRTDEETPEKDTCVKKKPVGGPSAAPSGSSGENSSARTGPTSVKGAISATVAPKSADSAAAKKSKKRAAVSEASKNLFAAFLKKKQKV